MISPYKSIFLNLFLFLIVTGFSNVYAQKAQLEGQVLDSLQQPIPNTNLIATPVSGDHNITFAIADQKGKYELKLEKEVFYKIEINSLGFASFTDSLAITENTHKNYILKESNEQLEQVVVKAKMAMVVDEDTITYRTDKFRAGDERKLREILKKLPGVEVDREGNVTIKGKKVSKLMVDGQDFFGGDTKLGVNNIPADAVEEIQAIDNYNEVSFMKGLSDSDQMAMNIKLKKDKKHFWFGESELGAGIKKRHYIQPRIFYYSPNTTLNLIGSINNVNESPLNFEDVMRFKGGYMSFLDNPIQSGDDGLMRFSTSTDTRHKKMQFGAANFSQKLSRKTRLEAYSIVAKQEVQSEIQTLTEYLTQDGLNENRNTQNKDRGFSNFNKIKIRHIPNNHKDMAYDVLANFSNNRYENLIHSRVADSLNQTQTHQDPHAIEINQYFRYNTQPSYEHTSEVKAEYSFKKANRLSDWHFDRPIFSDLIPFEEEDDYNFLQDYQSTTHSANASLKHYWVLNATNHLYPIGGMYFFNQDYFTHDFQRMQNGNINDFTTAGFGNDLNYQLIDPYFGLQYKFKLGEVIMRPGLMYHHYFWRVNQFSEKIADQNKGVLLPEFKLEYKISSAQKLEFNYNLRSSFADAEKYANRYSLRSFNRLYYGNEDLENSLYHNLNLSFRNFNLRTGITYYLNLSYDRKEKSVQHSTVMEGIDQVSSTFYSHFPENNLNANAYISKRWKFISSTLSFRGAAKDYTQIINGQRLNYNANNIYYALSGRTIFKSYPNLEVGYVHGLNKTKSQDFKNRYTSFAPYARLDYAFLDGFILKANYEYTYSKDQNTQNSQDFQLAGASLYYRKTDSRWGFEVKVNNLFDVDYKRNYQVDEFMIYDSRIYIQPRTALFILTYQL